LNKIKEKEEDK